ncbi:MAG TPA: hypothetical protein DCG53_05205, partial [Syntrophus sp. (in: bacteria)]|nr:hypothetical protein [Syntrophus sp. (in: bacteria)]
MKRLLLLSLVISLITTGCATTENTNVSPVQLALEAKMVLVFDAEEGERGQRRTEKQEVSVALAARVYTVA